ncbi:LysR substrate-binding domain-containing protein [Pseudomonas sp. NPDC089547]|uniref:LysR substrate-binding domain-containing protein n=1 Tax=Pseudomonas sp. NPDC089547 TaxID=3390652 RepID=UPI003D05F293
MKNQETGIKQKGYRRIVPSMTALLQFESVARLNSFTQAARELGVTQAAVSKQIKMLEENFGMQLFHRSPRGIQLTEDGHELFNTISESLQKIATVFDRKNQGARKKELVLGTTAAFSQFRVLPRLANLSEMLPNVLLRLSTQMFTGDLRTHEADLEVRYGNGYWGDGTASLLFEEEIFPVCSPDWLEKNRRPETLEELAGSDLLDADSTSEGWMNWQGWFRELGLNTPKLNYALRCNVHTDNVLAAVHGFGIALGWGRLVEDSLASGELVRLEPFVVRPTDAYYIVVPNGRETTAEIRAITQWLQAKAP